MFKNFEETFTFDDVLLVPQKSSILPSEAELQTKLTKSITLNLPFLSAPMDTVTDSRMAIEIALAGGVGVVHKNMSVEEQAEAVGKVKRHENGFIQDPITVNVGDPMTTVVNIRMKYGYKKVPVVDDDHVLVGFISDLDYVIPYDNDAKVKDLMQTLKDLHVGQDGITLDEAYQMIRKHRLRTFSIVDKKGRLVSMVTRRDLEKSVLYPNAAKNKAKQLLVGAAVSVGEAAVKRADAVVKAGADFLVVDTAHGHSAGVINAIKVLKKKYPKIDIIGGNIGTAEAARDLISAGADAVKAGIGPGSICTTRVVAGIGIPQLSAIMQVASGVKSAKRKVPIIADGGIKSSGDVIKALAAGANAVMMGNMFAGTDESPGNIEYIDGRMYKTYRGMGSLDAMGHGSKDRYGQADVQDSAKFVPEGVSGRVAYKGSVSKIVYQLAGGLRSGMGYNGAKTISELQKKAKFVRISNSALKESHPHDLTGIKDAPNYSIEP